MCLIEDEGGVKHHTNDNDGHGQPNSHRRLEEYSRSSDGDCNGADEKDHVDEYRSDTLRQWQQEGSCQVVHRWLRMEMGQRRKWMITERREREQVHSPDDLGS